MKYHCIVFDHDDTVVNSTATIHYPCFLEYEKIYHPGVYYSLEEFFALNFDPGVVGFFRDILKMDENEMIREEIFWKEYAENRIPAAYPGMKELLSDLRKAGCLLCVDSHSFSHNILRDYEANHLPSPDLIYGWDLPAEKRKPQPWTLFDLMKRYNLKPEEILVVDDLKPGYDMSRAAGVAFAAAGWANDIPQIENFMRKNSDYYFKTITELRKFLFA